MAISKIVLNTENGEQVLVDLTGDSVTPETLAEGVTAHGANGELIVGQMKSSEDLNAVLTEQEALIDELKDVLRSKASGEGGGTSDLPDGYSRIDYIQFNGNQWIDTGIIGNQDTQVTASFTWENSTQRHLYGCASSDNTASMTAYMNGSWRFGNKTSSKSLSSKNPMLPYTMLINKTSISVTNSVTSISGVNDFETVGTLLLGGCRDADGTQPGVGIVGKVFSFALWQGETLTMKLIPVVSSDGQYQFYDLISKTLFSSITSTPLDGGSF